MTAPWPLEDGVVTSSDIAFAAWLAELQRDVVITDHAAHMQPAEIALLRPLRRAS